MGLGGKGKGRRGEENEKGRGGEEMGGKGIGRNGREGKGMGWDGKGGERNGGEGRGWKGMGGVVKLSFYFSKNLGGAKLVNK